MGKSISQAVLLLGIIAIAISCSKPGKMASENGVEGYAKLQKASWLIGSWKGHNPEGNPSEYWEKINDSTFSGRGYFIIGSDTVSSEELRLEQHSDKLFYIPTVKTQNNGEPVKFVMTSSSDNQLVFENPRHDFPQKITYNLIARDSLLAAISGIIDGRESTRQFPMSRIKSN